MPPAGLGDGRAPRQQRRRRRQLGEHRPELDPALRLGVQRRQRHARRAVLGVERDGLVQVLDAVVEPPELARHQQARAIGVVRALGRVACSMRALEQRQQILPALGAMERAPRRGVHRVPRRRQLERAPIAAERRLEIAAPLLQPRRPLEQRRLLAPARR